MFEIFQNNRKVFFILGISCVFILISIYLYYYHISPRINPSYVSNKEFIKDDEAEAEAEIYLFYTTWCPHCKKAKPIWTKIKEEYDGKKINNHMLYFREVDCEKEEELADKFKIEGYPTIKLIVGNREIEYDAKPTEENIKEFIHSSLD